jgi:5-methylthioadenosine/S-adenosylhomocysteine deaminase
VAEKADELGVKMHIHVSEEEKQVTRSLEQHGMTPVEVLRDTGVLRKRTILAHAYYATEDDLRLIQGSGAVVAHCPKTYMKFGDMNDFLPRAVMAGVVVGLGTDGAASNSTMNLFEAARDAALLAKCATGDPEVATISEVLPLLGTASELLGSQDCGRIEEGALADLVLIHPHTPNMQPENDVFANLLYSVGDRNVKTVIVDGRVVVRDGKLVNVDLDALRHEVAAAAERLRVPAEGPPKQTYRMEE